MPTEKSEVFVSLFKDSYPKLRQRLAQFLVFVLVTSSLITDPLYKSAVLSTLGGVLVFLCIDIYNELSRRLSGIESSLQENSPPEFPDFHAVGREISATIAETAREADVVTLDFITISASYSWGLLENSVRQIVPALLQKNKRLEITLGVVQPNHLDRWGLSSWRTKSELVLSLVEDFKQAHKKEISKGVIKFTLCLYDNIPHWHGILVNDNVLFLGRTEWKNVGPDCVGSPELLVGQVEYRRFHKTDRFGGAGRIERFRNWTRRYELRHAELHADSTASP